MKHLMAIVWCLLWSAGGWTLIFMTAISTSSPHLSPLIGYARISLGVLVPVTALITLGVLLYKKYMRKVPFALWKTLLPLHLLLLALVISMSIGWG